jgi:vacuolar protein sorting-associated protein 45
VDERTDEFFAANLFTEFSDLGKAVSDLTQAVTAQHIDVNDIKDVEALKKFIHNYPIYERKKSVAAKHAELLGDVSSAISSEILIQIAPVEQKIATEDDAGGHLQQVLEFLRDPHTTDDNALRLALLYALRYAETQAANLETLRHAIRGRPQGSTLVEAVDGFVRFAGQGFRRPDTLFAKAKSVFSRARGLIGMDENRFHLHQPGIAALLQRLQKVPFDLPQFSSAQEIMGNVETKKIIIFYVGGVTYEEASLAYQACTEKLDIIVGGTTVHNMNSFVFGEALK